MPDEREQLRREWVDPQRSVSGGTEGLRAWAEHLQAAPTPPHPTAGLCSAWCTSAEVAALVDAVPDADYTQVAIMASEVLYEVSGRRFRGVCAAVDRPGAPMPNPWPWDAGWGWRDSPAGGGWGWWPSDEYGIHDLREWWPILCARSDRIVLRYSPVRSITKVTIDGVEVAKAGFQIEDGHYLRRIDGGAWPVYQDLARTTGRGTFSVEYAHGQEPPVIGKQAAASLALVLGKALAGEEVSLPFGVTSLVRQGVTMTRAAIAEMRVGGFGIPIIDLFLDTYRVAAAAVWSPDMAEEGPRIGGFP